jgi:hypothetical protein
VPFDIGRWKDDFCFWHEADISDLRSDVRYWGELDMALQRGTGRD